MLTVTPGAGARLLRKLARKGATDDMAMRFTRRTDGWRLRVDHARPADTAITHEGRIVLLLDEQVVQTMANMTLGVTDTETGPRLTLR
jgi:hypothetical protein